MDTLTDERLEREFNVTEKALNEISIIVGNGDKNHSIAIKFVDTAKRYFEDAKFFRDKGDKASAFGALNYAFGWLDAGRTIGLFKETKYLKEKIRD
jgi:uncharacterized protein